MSHFKNTCIRIKQDLAQHHRDKKYLEVYYVQARLQKSLQTYYKELAQSVNYLEDRNPENVLVELR